jgi:hypothetical protein
MNSLKTSLLIMMLCFLTHPHAVSQGATVSRTLQEEASELPVFHYYDSYWNATVDFYRPNATSPELCFRETPIDSRSYKFSCGTGAAYLRMGYDRYPGFCHFYNTHHPYVALPYSMMQTAFEIYARHCFEVDCTEILCDEDTCWIDHKTQRDCNYDAHSLRLLLMQLMLETPGIKPGPDEFSQLKRGISRIRDAFYNGIETSYDQAINATNEVLNNFKIQLSDNVRNMVISTAQKLHQDRKSALRNFNYALGSLCYTINKDYSTNTTTDVFVKISPGWCYGFAPDFDPDGMLIFKKH